MPWIKKGLLYKPDGSLPHSRTHAQVPYAAPQDDFLRIYFSTRDDSGQSRPTFIDVEYDDFTNIRYIHDRPVLDLGGPGEYDETGSMPASFVPQKNGDIWLYYTGWNRGHHAYRLSIGLSVSTDGGLTFKKMFNGPILDRSIANPLWAAQPWVMKENGRYRMWYISSDKGIYVDGHLEPYYCCKYAESEDGIHWRADGHVCLAYDEFLHAVGRPVVYKDGDLYKMYYSYRNIHNYRTDRNFSYRLGYAESADGLDWTRKDDQVGIAKSENPDDFDYLMINYAHRFTHDGRQYLIYNGKGFGASGFAYAEWQD